MAQACNPNAGEVKASRFLGTDDHQARVFGEFQGSPLRDLVSKKTRWTALRGDTRKLTTRLHTHRGKKIASFLSCFNQLTKRDIITRL